MLFVDRFGIFFKGFLVLFLALIIALWLLGQASRRVGSSSRRLPFAPEFFVLLLTSALGMALMVSTLNLLVMIIAIEMASLPSYAIVGSEKVCRRGAEASLKYVTFGAASSSIMIYGVSLLYGCFGTLDIPTMAHVMVTEVSRVGLVAGIGLAAMLVGIFFKISAVPFHFWCPDVFEGAPIEVTTWLSVASKAAGLGLLLRIVAAFYMREGNEQLFAPLAWGIGLVAAVTCTVGNLAALRQSSVKRMLAYSSIAHAGYMMMAAAILVPAGRFGEPNYGLGAVIAYLFVYLLMNLGAFGVTAMVSWRTGTDDISAFSGLGRRAPMLALPMAVCLFSLVGLPPLAGFTAKWYLLYALGKAAAGQPWLWVLVMVAVVNTAISLYYYVSIIRQMYLTDDPAAVTVTAPVGGLAIVNLCAVGLVLFGTLFFNTLGHRANNYAAHLMNTATVVAPSQGASMALPTADLSGPVAQADSRTQP